MKFKSSILVSFLVIVISSAAAAQGERRIIRADRPGNGDDSGVLQLLGLKIGERSIALNEIFVADENWLKELKITVRNVSGKDLRCVGISLGVLDGLDTKLGPRESWGWKMNYTNGQCSNLKTSTPEFRKGESVDLIWYSEPLIVPDRTPWPSFHKAVLDFGFARYKGDSKNRDVHDFRLTLPLDTKFLDDNSY